MSQEYSPSASFGDAHSPSQPIETPLSHDLKRAAAQIGRLDAALSQFSEIEREIAESRVIVGDAHLLKESLERAESSVRRLQQSHDQLKVELADAIDRAASKEAALTTENSRLSEELHQAETVYVQLCDECECLKADLNASQTESVELRQMHDSFRLQSSQTQSQLRSELEQAETSLMREQEGRGVSEKELDAARLRISHLQARLEDLNAANQHSTQRTDEQTSQLQAQIKELTHQITVLKSQRIEPETNTAGHDQLELERDEFRLQVVALQGQLEKLRSQEPSHESEIAHRKQTRELQYQIKQLEADLRETTHQLEISQLKMVELQRNSPNADTQQSVYVDALMQDAKALCDAAKQREEAAHANAARLEAEIADLRFEFAALKRDTGSQPEGKRIEIRHDAASATQFTVHAHEFQQREKRRKIHDAKQAGQH